MKGFHKIMDDLDGFPTWDKFSAALGIAKFKQLLAAYAELQKQYQEDSEDE